MAYIEMYGRPSPSRENVFEYPTTMLPLRRGPPVYFAKPAAAAPIFGVTRVPVMDSDETRVQLDPSSTYSYTKRWKGLGDAPVDDTGLPKRPFLEAHPGFAENVKEGFDKVVENPILTGIIVVILGAVAVQALRVVGGATAR